MNWKNWGKHTIASSHFCTIPVYSHRKNTSFLTSLEFLIILLSNIFSIALQMLSLSIIIKHYTRKSSHVHCLSAQHCIHAIKLRLPMQFLFGSHCHHLLLNLNEWQDTIGTPLLSSTTSSLPIYPHQTAISCFNLSLAQYCICSLYVVLLHSDISIQLYIISWVYSSQYLPNQSSLSP